MDALAREARAAAPGRAPSDLTGAVAIEPVAPADIERWLGVYRDPWFGEVRLCAQGSQVRFAARKSPLLAGKIVRAGPRLRVDWDADEVEAEAWIDFAGDGATATFAMSKVDPDADFSYDYEDLAFARIGGCG